MVGTAEFEPDHIPMPHAPPSTPEKAHDHIYDDEDESVSESESVTTEDVMESIMPRRMPAIRVQAHMDLPAWFVVVVSYVFAYGLGSFATRCSN